MLAAVSSAGVLGIDAYQVTVEVDAAAGLPQFTVVGMPAGSVRESRERVSAALVQSGFTLPPRRVTVNLAPADRRKEGTAFDLPIALGILSATGQLDPRQLREAVFLGELGLDGSVRSIRGALPVALHVARSGGGTLVIPPGNVGEASLVGGLTVSAPRTLRALVENLRRGSLEIASAQPRSGRSCEVVDDLADVAGQEIAKRALEVAAAGSHNLLMIGPPGAGKTMLARRLTGLLPALSESEMLEVTAIHSVAGLIAEGDGAVRRRPFRAPHHTISTGGLIGGGGSPRPGEVSLAHHGVLFLDELLEFPRHALEALRQPLEDGKVVISRALASLSLPARFALVAAMNPCPCGMDGDPAGRCTCSTAMIQRYRARLSGPLADRMDIHVAVGSVPIPALSTRPPSEATAAVRARVEAARARQRHRTRSTGGAACNAHIPARWLDTLLPITSEARARLSVAAERLGLSARAYHRVLRVALTIADLDGDDLIGVAAIAEALHYRPLSTEAGAQGWHASA
jgi:magnesium chelatase family protein